MAGPGLRAGSLPAALSPLGSGSQTESHIVSHDMQSLSETAAPSFCLFFASHNTRLPTPPTDVTRAFFFFFCGGAYLPFFLQG